MELLATALTEFIESVFVPKDLLLRLKIAPVAFPKEVLDLVALRAEEAGSPVKATKEGYMLNGRRLTDFTLRPLRWKQTRRRKLLECTLTLGEESVTADLPADVLWSAAALTKAVNVVKVGEVTPRVLLPRQTDLLRSYLIEQTEGLKTVDVVEWPGLHAGVYHLPGLAVSLQGDHPSGLDCGNYWSHVPDKPLRFTGAGLHLLMMAGAMMARSAVHLPVGHIALRTDAVHDAAVIALSKALGQLFALEVPSRVAPFVHIAPRGGAPVSGGIRLTEDGVMLADVAEIREITPSLFFAHCIRRALSGQAKFVSTESLVVEGAALLESHQPNMMPIRLDLHNSPNICRLLRLIGEDTAKAFRFDLPQQAYAFQPQEYDLEPGPIYKELRSRDPGAITTNGISLFIKETTLKRLLLLYHKKEMPLGVGPRIDGYVVQAPPPEDADIPGW